MGITKVEEWNQLLEEFVSVAFVTEPAQHQELFNKLTAFSFFSSDSYYDSDPKNWKDDYKRLVKSWECLRDSVKSPMDGLKKSRPVQELRELNSLLVQFGKFIYETRDALKRQMEHGVIFACNPDNKSALHKSLSSERDVTRIAERYLPTVRTLFAQVNRIRENDLQLYKRAGLDRFVDSFSRIAA